MSSLSDKHGVLFQLLLKRHSNMSPDEFQEYYQGTHGPLAIPFFLANHVVYYAQIHQPLSWSSADVAAKHPDIHLGDWDAAAEVALEEGYDFETMTNASTYFSEIILPDERRVFVDEARKHMKAVPAGAVKGSWVEFIVDGKAVVDFEKAREAWEGHEGKASWRGLRVM